MLEKSYLVRSEILVLNIELEKVIFMQSVASNIIRIFIAGNNLQQVRKVTFFEHILSIV